MTEPTIIVRADRVQMFQKRHPWVFSGAIQGTKGEPADGDVVTLRSPDGAFLARGYWNHHSQIHVHVLTWDEAQVIDTAFWRERLSHAIQARVVEEMRRESGPVGYRLINAESDGLPGLVVDRYGDWLVLQALTLGMDKRKHEIAGLLMELMQPAGIVGIYERSDVDVRQKEGLRQSAGVLAGTEPPALIEINEYGRRYLVDVRGGHKTGFYLDQRENRATLARWLKSDPSLHASTVLNCFSYSGGFAVAAMATGNRAINIDASADALALARQNIGLNGFKASDDDFVEGDAFNVLRHYRAEKQQFDVIVLDPPKFAQNQRQVESACRGYKDINLLAFQLLRPGGLLLTFSCSGLIDADLFQKVVFGALVDARRDAQILERLTAGSDHPVALTFPEAMYLKGLLCRVW